MNFIKKIFTKKWFQFFYTFLLAVILFAYVIISNGDSNKTSQNTNHKQTLPFLNKKTANIKVPVIVKINHEHYYVSGIPKEIKIQLRGSSGIITAAQNSRTIRAIVDLSKPKLGNQKINPEITGISNNLDSQISKPKLNINISKRLAKKLPIIPIYNRSDISDHHSVSKFNISKKNAIIYGTKRKIKKAKYALANLSVPSNAKNTVKKKIPLKPISKSGSNISTQIKPTDINIKLGITKKSTKSHKKSTKTVPLNLKFTGFKDISNYNITLSSPIIQITGPKNAIEKTKMVSANVNLNNINNKGGLLPVHPSLPPGISKLTPRVINVDFSPK